jgi:Zn-dependent protease
MEPDSERGYEPVHPRGTDWRGLLRKITAPIVVAFGVIAKLGFLAKFSLIFVALAGYALIWGWTFGVGFVLLIFCHEMGHFLEARREGLRPRWPVFIPFLGAYVQHTRGNPWQAARVAIAGPILGGAAALACYLVGRAEGSGVLIALAYAGFLLNLINLLPLWILDGATVWNSTRWLWYGGGRNKAIVSGVLYAGTALLLLLGAYSAYAPQHRV